MTSREVLRTQLDTLQMDMNVLEVENQRLRSDHPDRTEALEAEQELAWCRKDNVCLSREVDKLRELYEQLLRGTQEAEAEATPADERCAALELKVSEFKCTLERESTGHTEQWELARSLQGELEDALRKTEELTFHCRQFEAEKQQMSRDSELELYRAIATVTNKWEIREARLMRQLEELEEKIRVETEAVVGSEARAELESAVNTSAVDTPDVNTSAVNTPERANGLSPKVHGDSWPDGEPTSTVAAGVPRPPSGIAVIPQDPLSMAMLVQQLPPLPNFTGDSQGNEEVFDEWLERLEMAGMCGWSEQEKMVNLVTRLRGPAYLFYQSCTSSKRSDYPSLTTALSKHFTPVFLQSVQSSRFHKRKQQSSESVDTYAQELKRPFYRAYPTVRQRSSEYSDVIALDNTELSCTDLVTHSIDTGDHRPIWLLPRRIPFALCGKISEMVEEMLQQGVIVPSYSPWASPVVLVAKDGSTRFCVDYCRLNSVTKMDVYPLPALTTPWTCYHRRSTLRHSTWHRGTGRWGWMRPYVRRLLLSPIPDYSQTIRICGDAIWPVQCAGHIPKAHGNGVSRPGSREVYDLPWWWSGHGEDLWGSLGESESCLCTPARSWTEAETIKVPSGATRSVIPWLCSLREGYYGGPEESWSSDQIPSASRPEVLTIFPGAHDLLPMLRAVFFCSSPTAVCPDKKECTFCVDSNLSRGFWASQATTH